MGPRKISLVKIDCEGCEWSAIVGAKRTLRRTPMLKIELVQPKYTDGNSSVTPQEVVRYLYNHGFDIFKDHWLENHLYFGKDGDKVLDIDKIFGNTKLNVPIDLNFLDECAKKILSDQINPETFDGHQFQKSYTDIIVIERSLSAKLKYRFLGITAEVHRTSDALDLSVFGKNETDAEDSGAEGLAKGFKYQDVR